MESRPTPVDLNFRLFRFPVRVHPLFWLASVILGVDTFYDRQIGPLAMLVWVACVFVSILVHELGHALAARRFGSPCRILLYSFGGLAIYDYAPRDPWRRMAVALAGPAAGFVLFGVVWGTNLALGWEEWAVVLDRFYEFLFWINLVWGLFNLFPIWPLDGGKVCREALELARVRRPEPTTYMVGVVTAGLLAVLALALKLGVAPRAVRDALPFGVGWFTIVFVALLGVQNFLQWQQANRAAATWDDDDYGPQQGRW